MNAYQALTERFQRLARLDHLSAIAGWDMQTMMPSGGSDARGEALAELSVMHHEILVQSSTAELIALAQQETLNSDQQANLNEISRHYADAALLPTELVEAKALAGSRCEQAWRQQRIENDWQGFQRNLTPVVELSRQEAQLRAKALGCSPYDALLNLYEPGMTSQRLDTLFGELIQWLPELLQQIVAKQPASSTVQTHRVFPLSQQKALAESVMQLLDFDFTHGRLDVSAHPFCGGVPTDVRITTRYNTDEFLSALMGVIHETGHARYEQNLPKQWPGQPIALARSTAIHESQSLFLEMQLGRSKAFLQRLHPLICQHLTAATDLSLNDLVQQVQHVSPGFIRVDADEVSYPAHIVLRYEIERSLINGEVEVSDIPELWDEKMQRYLGLSTAGNYRNGCMQDIHWTDGSFGYFPTYTLGAMYAAQLFNTLQQQLPNLDEAITLGNLAPIFAWLKENIWSKGSRFPVDSLIQQATGETLNPKWFKQHLERRYLGD
ncbi:carboxypeptidase M32 [Rosenbergiella sp. S61]|uniref:Metal-dependent carboxypeptidase n=1 Tax=Rosenbergiella gaditana TaxID=2726987 RepID=A0ABS5SSS0_9GAMM|nr:carboxypeptidase M32 [Rosenbergiella gaditana]MBT0723071.1 carboxypeptidase M32 [Rosenbergiella gaditana]